MLSVKVEDEGKAMRNIHLLWMNLEHSCNIPAITSTSQSINVQIKYGTYNMMAAKFELWSAECRGVHV